MAGRCATDEAVCARVGGVVVRGSGGRLGGWFRAVAVGVPRWCAWCGAAAHVWLCEFSMGLVERVGAVVGRAHCI